MIVPERRAGVVVLINLEDGHASDLGTELMKIVLGSWSLPKNRSAHIEANCY
jgi:hypothetical protein